MSYKINKEKTRAKLKTLTLSDLNLLCDLLAKELSERHRLIENRSSTVFDVGGDVLEKHHNVTESEAFDRYCEEEF